MPNDAKLDMLIRNDAPLKESARAKPGPLPPPQTPTIPPACQFLQAEIDDLDTEIQDLTDSFSEVPPASRPGIRALIVRLGRLEARLGADLQSCIANPEPFALQVDGIEVSQSVQSLDNAVPLIAGKATVVRVYVSWLFASAITLRGTLTVNGQELASINSITLQGPSATPISDRRNDLSRSFNFVLPSSLTAAGQATIVFGPATDVATGEQHVVANSQASVVKVAFEQSPALHVRLLGIRYQAAPVSNPNGPKQTFVASDFDFRMILSWLRRAYPVASVVSAQAIVDSNTDPPFDCNQMNAQVAAIRALDMASGGDPKAHYFGLVGDGNGQGFWMRGCSAIPGSPDPSAVGSGPTGNANWGWDFDGCYGDWYTGHELGHTFGRLHPGSGCGESADDPHYPFPAGQLAGADDAYVGLDVGDAALNLPMAVYPGPVWHDVMTYCQRQWLSSYTYQGIHDRLVGENPAGAPGAGAPDMRYTAPDQARTADLAAPARFAHVVGLINETKGSGSLEYMLALPSVPPGQAVDGDGTGPVSLRYTDVSGAPLATYKVTPKPIACTPADADRHALLDVTVPIPPGAAAIELIVRGQVVDRRVAGAGTAPLAPLRIYRQDGGHSVSWEVPAGAGDGRTYSVQFSTDEGKTWSTLAVGLKSPKFDLDRSHVAGSPRVRIRVLATDGFSTSTVESETVTLD